MEMGTVPSVQFLCQNLFDHDSPLTAINTALEPR
jgi:hypothetical protein